MSVIEIDGQMQRKQDVTDFSKNEQYKEWNIYFAKLIENGGINVMSAMNILNEQRMDQIEQVWLAADERSLENRLCLDKCIMNIDCEGARSMGPI